MESIKNTSISVETPDAETQGRNGPMKCIKLVFYIGNDTVDIWTINSKGCIGNAGTWDIPIDAMDELCKKYLEVRQKG